jgi:hypothetical protein
MIRMYLRIGTCNGNPTTFQLEKAASRSEAALSCNVEAKPFFTSVF